MKRRIAILAPRLDRGDAVGNDALGMRDSLVSAGFEVGLFAEGWTISDRVFHVRTLPAFIRSRHDILLYHYSIAWPTALGLFRSLPCAKIVRFHNVTPAKFFEPYHAGITESCRAGIRMIRDFAATDVRLWLTPSHFNKTELMMHDVPAEHVAVVPIFHRVDMLLTRAPQLYTIDRMQYKKSGPAFLTLGRIAPNKGLAYLIQEFALFRTHQETGSLWIVGKKVPPLIRYSQELDALVRAHGLRDHVHFVGPASESMLKSFYVCADAYITSSEHEGFCVPLVEAMGLRLPVLAARQAAVEETLGNAAVIVDRAPGVLAHAMDQVAHRLGTVHALSLAGEERYRSTFSLDSIDGAFRRATKEVTGSS